jgi:hypothetical protein
VGPVPDGEDYQWLAELTSHPDRWTTEDARSIRLMIATQKRALVDLHPLDRRGRESARAVLEKLEAALDAYLARGQC